MDNDLAKQIQQRLAELPESIRNAIQSADLTAKVRTLGEKHHLHIDQMGELESEVLMVMMGFTDPAVFAAQIAANLALNPELSEKLAADINTEVFLPIRSAMQEFAARKTVAATMPPPHPADQVLTEKTVTVAPPVVAPTTYSTDPYREPIN